MQTRNILSVAILSVAALSFAPFALAAHHEEGHDEMDEMKKDAMAEGKTMKKDAMGEAHTMKKDTMDKSKAMKKDAMGEAHSMKKDTMDAGKTMKKDAMVRSPAFHGGESTHVCTQGNLVRTVAVVYTNAPDKLPCEVQYTKNTGDTNTIYSATSTAGFCEGKAQELSGKLASSGWNCSVK